MSIDVHIGNVSINMANGNFATIWSILGIDTMEMDGSVNAGNLMASIMLADAMGVQERPRVQDGNYIVCGLPEHYIKAVFIEMLDALAEVPNDTEVTWW